MGRRTESAEDGKRTETVVVHLTQAEYDDVVCTARAMTVSKSAYFARIHHIFAYGLLGEKPSHIRDEDGSNGIDTLVKADFPRSA